MTSSINNSTTAYGRITTGRSRAAVGGNIINLNENQINAFVNGSNNVDSRTLGWGMTFMHETLHTATGGSLTDHPTNGSITGQAVDKLNIVRNELNQNGGNYGQRKVYKGILIVMLYSCNVSNKLSKEYYTNSYEYLNALPEMQSTCLNVSDTLEPYEFSLFYKELSDVDNTKETLFKLDSLDHNSNNLKQKFELLEGIAKKEQCTKVVYFSNMYNNMLMAEIIETNEFNEASHDEIAAFNTSNMFLFTFNDEKEIIKVYKKKLEYD